MAAQTAVDRNDGTGITHLSALDAPVFRPGGRSLRRAACGLHRGRGGSVLRLDGAYRLPLELIGGVARIQHGRGRDPELRLGVRCRGHVRHLALDQRGVLPVVLLDAPRRLEEIPFRRELRTGEQRAVAFAARID